MLGINSKLIGEELLSQIENWDTSQSDCKCYSYLQRLLSIWHDIIHMIRWIVMVHPSDGEA
jgi:hypothetical protein